MAEYATLTQRSVFTAQALATMGVDPTWDAKLAQYLARSACARAEEQFGPSQIAEEDRKSMMFGWSAKYGEGWQNHADVKAELACFDHARNVEQAVVIAQYYEPMWQASRELAITPAPTLAAALFKAAMIDAEEVWNDNAIVGECIDIVNADFARLMEEAARGPQTS